MNRTPSAAHAAHDELLIARLFGGDVSETERARALDQMGECGECAALFADLGDIADATETMPIPVRPRDFSLTEADAARLRRRRWTRGAIFRAGLRRSLGGSLATLGLVGFMLTGGLSLLGGSASASAPESVTADNRAAGPYDQGAIAVGSLGVGDGAAASEAPAGIVAGGAPSPGGTYAALASEPAPGATPAATAQPAPQAPQPTSSDVNAPALSVSSGGNKSVPEGAASQSGIDTRLLWFGGFGVLFFLGVATLLIPALLRRRHRGMPRS
jgi:hypothetical protein